MNLNDSSNNISITTSDNNQIRGTQYEYQIKKYLIDNYPQNKIYLWKETPLKLLIDVGIVTSNINDINPCLQFCYKPI
jgi:hypothetical protein